jgi:hypothetical protein
MANAKFSLGDSSTVCTGKRNPLNAALVARVRELGSLTIEVEGQRLTLVKTKGSPNDTPWQVYPATPADHKVLESLFTAKGKGAQVEYSEVEA